MAKRTRLLFSLGTLVAFTLACGGPVPGESDIDVEECAGDADVDDVTYITWEFEESVHEMITCGQLTFQLLYALVQSAETFLSDPSSAPSAFSQDAGVYTTTGEGVAMDLTVVYGPDSPGGTNGEPVGADVFAPESYLVGFAAETDDDEVYTVTFDSPGPLVALLGQGSDPESPLTLDSNDLNTLGTNLSSLYVGSLIMVDDEVKYSTITYTVDNSPVEALQMLMGMSMEMDLKSTSGERPDLNQSLTTRVWNIAYGDAAGTLDGVIEAEMTGADFDFQAVYEYFPTDPEPFVTITCL